MNVLFSYPITRELLSFSGMHMPWIIRDARDEALEKETERIVAELCVDIIERYGYRLADIMVGELVPIVTPAGWDYPEIDILVRGDAKTPTLVIEAVPADHYATDQNRILAKLFAIAPAIRHSIPSSPLYLVLYTRGHISASAGMQEMALVIDYDKTPGFEAWIHAGSPAFYEIPVVSHYSE